MPTTLNADTVVGGAIITGDTSGVLELQAAGSTKATISGSGVTLSSALPVGSGGTGATTLTGVLKGNGTSAVTASNVNLASEVTGTLPVGNGGSGATTLTGILKGNGTSAFSAAVSGTDIKTVNSTSLLGSGNVSVGVTSVSGTGSANGLSLSGTVSSTGDITLSGTSYSSNNVLLGNGTSSFQTVAPGSNGNILTSNGSTWVSSAPAGGGNYVFVTSSSPSSVTSVTLSLSGGVAYMLLGMNVRLGSDVSSTFNARFDNLTSNVYSSGGSYYDGGNVFWGLANQPRMRLAEMRQGLDNNSQYQHLDFVLWINPGIAGTTFPTVWAHSRFTGQNGATAFSCVGGGSYSDRSTAATSIVVDLGSSGTNSFSGNFYLYKITT